MKNVANHGFRPDADPSRPLARAFGQNAGNRLRGRARRSRHKSPLPALTISRHRSRCCNSRRIRHWLGRFTADPFCGKNLDRCQRSPLAGTLGCRAELCKLPCVLGGLLQKPFREGDNPRELGVHFRAGRSATRPVGLVMLGIFPHRAAARKTEPSSVRPIFLWSDARARCGALDGEACSRLA